MSETPTSVDTWMDRAFKLGCLSIMWGCLGSIGLIVFFVLVVPILFGVIGAMLK